LQTALSTAHLGVTAAHLAPSAVQSADTTAHVAPSAAQSADTAAHLRVTTVHVALRAAQSADTTLHVATSVAHNYTTLPYVVVGQKSWELLVVAGRLTRNPINSRPCSFEIHRVTKCTFRALGFFSIPHRFIIPTRIIRPAFQLAIR
jgi:hypothetical protein